MAELMADLHTAEAVVESNSETWHTDSSKRALRQSVYARHGVSDADVDSSFNWYGHHLKEYMEVYDETIEILENRIAEAEHSGDKTPVGVSNISPDGDSVNIWQGPATLRISSLNPTEFLSFSYQTDRNWERGDCYTLSLKPMATRAPIFMTISVNYNDGSAEYVTLTQASENSRHLTLVLDSAKIASNIFGSIHYTPVEGEISYIDSISLVRTRTKGNNAGARASQHTVRTR